MVRLFFLRRQSYFFSSSSLLSLWSRRTYWLLRIRSAGRSLPSKRAVSLPATWAAPLFSSYASTTGNLGPSFTDQGPIKLLGTSAAKRRAAAANHRLRRRLLPFPGDHFAAQRHYPPHHPAAVNFPKRLVARLAAFMTS